MEVSSEPSARDSCLSASQNERDIPIFCLLTAIFILILVILILQLVMYISMMNSRRSCLIRPDRMCCGLSCNAERPVEETYFTLSNDSIHKADSKSITSEDREAQLSELSRQLHDRENLKIKLYNKELNNQIEETSVKLSSNSEDTHIRALKSSVVNYPLTFGEILEPDSMISDTEFLARKVNEVSVVACNSNSRVPERDVNSTNELRWDLLREDCCLEIDGSRQNVIPECTMANDSLLYSDHSESMLDGLLLDHQSQPYLDDFEVGNRATSPPSVISLRADSPHVNAERAPLVRPKDKDLCCIVVGRYEFVRRIQYGANDDVEVMVSGIALEEGRRIIAEALRDEGVQTRVDVSDRSDGRWSPIRTVTRN